MKILPTPPKIFFPEKALTGGKQEDSYRRKAVFLHMIWLALDNLPAKQIYRMHSRKIPPKMERFKTSIMILHILAWILLN